MALFLNPFPQAELVLCRSEEVGLLFGVDATLLHTKMVRFEHMIHLSTAIGGIGRGGSTALNGGAPVYDHWMTYIIENQQHFTLLSRSRR